MEIYLTSQADAQVTVACDGQPSHAFDLHTLVLEQSNQRDDAAPVSHPLVDPVAYGKVVYAALFPPESVAQLALAAYPEQILLVIEEPALQSIPWEYMYGPDGFLVLDYHVARGLPPEQRITLTIPEESRVGVHIVAVPSNPLHRDVAPLDIEGEWTRLTEVIRQVDGGVTLERTRPPTLDQLRTLLANQRHRVVHFMGHGGSTTEPALGESDDRRSTESALLFEDPTGAPKAAAARNIVRRLRGTAFLVTLNACVSATPGETRFSDMAAALAEHKIPYALGMRFSILDDDARRFSRAFYDELARGSTVEEATRQARITLADGRHDWAIGVPVLYTSLAQPASLPMTPGPPRVLENLPPLELSALPRAEGTFQGRTAELIAIGKAMTRDARPRLLTIHGGGGQGKTTLAREAAERFAHAWPGGIWAISLENLPSRRDVATRLAIFLGIEAQQIVDAEIIEQQVLTQLGLQRTLIVLDNAETLVEAVRENKPTAHDLVDFVLDRLMGTRAHVMVTSRTHLGWAGEEALALGGLSANEGATFFRQNAPQRRVDIDAAQARALSEKVEGHPLALRLLGRAFNELSMPLADFVAEYEGQMVQATDRYRHEDHRHRTLYASIETSVRHLDTHLRRLLAGLWIFHAPFLAESAAAIFEDEHSKNENVPDTVHQLWQRGLLARQKRTLRDGSVVLYQLLPVTRPYVEHVLAVEVMPEVDERQGLLQRFGMVYAALVRTIYGELSSSAALVHVAQQALSDLERGHRQITGEDQAWYWVRWGWILQRLGDPIQGLQLIQQALNFAQETHQQLQLTALNNMAGVYRSTGKPAEALKLYEEALPIMREVGDRAGEATTLNNMAGVYRSTGKPAEALKLYEEALPIMREVGDRAGEATTLNNMAGVYRSTGKPAEALKLYEEALPIMREVGDRAGEATTLNNMAGVYRSTGKPAEALKLYEEALPIMREVGDRAGEATTLNNMAGVYRSTGKPAEALKLYEEALPIMREVGDRAGEATTLNNMAGVYDATGKPAEALKLYEEALPIMREVGDRAGEATTLNNMAGVYDATGKPAEALKLYEEALPIRREVGDRAGEATTLNNMAGVYRSTGKPAEALKLYEEALPIRREVGDRAGEATTLNNMAGVYDATGKPAEALKLYEEALPIMREVGDRAGEATTLNNMAGVYDATGKPAEALKLYEEALPIRREVGDRAGEATTLNNMAGVYRSTGKPAEALKLYEEALPIRREVGDRAGEATTLNNMALVYRSTGKPAEALKLYEEALPIRREVGDRAGEAATLNGLAYLQVSMEQYGDALTTFSKSIQLEQEVGHRAGEAAGWVGMGILYHRNLGLPADAINCIEQALAILTATGLPQDAAGHTATQLQQLLDKMNGRGDSATTDSSGPVTLTPEQRGVLIQNTIAVLTEMPDKAGEWQKTIDSPLQQVAQLGPDGQIEADYLAAISALLDGEESTLPADHPYAEDLRAIQDGIK